MKPGRKWTLAGRVAYELEVGSRPNDDLTTALLDRPTHHCETVSTLSGFMKLSALALSVAASAHGADETMVCTDSETRNRHSYRARYRVSSAFQGGKRRTCNWVRHAMVLYRAAFDIVRVTTQLELTDPSAIARNTNAIIAYEVKSTNKIATNSDFSGYFFDLTTAELVVTQSLGRFAFVKTLSRVWTEITLNGIFGRAPESIRNGPYLSKL
jgi:hypothetical protein